jgi:outer membrane protein
LHENACIKFHLANHNGAIVRHVKISRKILAAALRTALGVCHAQSVHAQSVDPKEPAFSDTTQWWLGAGVGTMRSPYRGVSNRTDPLPFILYESRYVHFFGSTVDLKLPAVDNLGFTLRAKYLPMEGYKSNYSDALNGMDTRRGSIWLGPTGTWRAPYAKLSLEWLTDASGNSKGNTLKLGIDRAFQYGRYTLTPHAGATWMDSKYVDYYYGVKSSEVTASRPLYAGKSTTDIEAGLRTDYALTRNQLVLIDLTDIRRGTGITDSPLVDKSSSFSIRVGYLYKF